MTTSLFGYVATRKSFAWMKPPNGIAFGTTFTTCSGPKTPLPGAVSVRILIVKTWPSGNSPGFSSPSSRAHVMYVRLSGPTVTSENWTSWSTVLIWIGSVHVWRSSEQRTALIDADEYPSGADSSMTKSL